MFKVRIVVVENMISAFNNCLMSISVNNPRTQLCGLIILSMGIYICLFLLLIQYSNEELCLYLLIKICLL